MSTQDIALFRGLGTKMGYLNKRQTVISQNIANADTPDYQAMELKKADFSSILRSIPNANRNGVKPVTLDTTRSGHMTPNGAVADPKARDDRDVYEVAPAGNAVVVEEQLISAGQTVMDYNMMTNLYQKHVGMIKTALGR